MLTDTQFIIHAILILSDNSQLDRIKESIDIMENQYEGHDNQQFENQKIALINLINTYYKK